jgi:WD40 repeat protein
VLWSLETGKPLGTPLDYGRIWHIFHSATESYFIAVTGHSEAAIRMRVVNEVEDQLVEVCTLPRARSPVAFSPNGEFVITRDDNKAAHFWSTTTWKEVMEPLFLPGGIRTFDFFPQGDLVAFLCGDDIVRFWSPATGQSDSTTRRHPHADAIAVSPDGGQVATGGKDKQVILWDFATKRPTGIVLAHNGPVSRIAYTRDGERILTATEDGNVYMWDAATGERIGPPIVERDTAARVVFGPQRNRVLVGTESSAELWDVDLSTAGAINEPDIWVQAITGRRMNSSGALEWLDRPTWLKCEQRAAKQ